MELSARIEAAIATALAETDGSEAPPRLSRALHHAVLPGGARIRPVILTHVALACGDDRPALTDAAAAALELIHCASLVHDDLPCFDDAGTRRGKPSVHAAFGQPLAVLAGDSLIVAAFETLARAAPADPARAVTLLRILAHRTGMPGGICAGQGWESEDEIDLGAYHRAKTGALFVAATQMGAVAAGDAPEPWEELGQRIGEAFQIADDLRDAALPGMGPGMEPGAATGKPPGQDAAHGRPNAVAELGLAGAMRRLEDILSGAIASIPSCPGEAMLAGLVTRTAKALVPGRIALPGE